MQMFIIIILVGVGGWLIWDHSELTKQLEESNAKVTEITKKAEENQKRAETAILAYAKVAPGPAAEMAKRFDIGQNSNGGTASSMSKLVPKPSAMEERRNKGATLLDGPVNNSGRR